MSFAEHNIVNKIVIIRGIATACMVTEFMATPETVDWIFQSPETYIEEFTKEETIQWELRAYSPSRCTPLCDTPPHSLHSPVSNSPLLNSPPILTESPIACEQLSSSNSSSRFEAVSIQSQRCGTSQPDVSTLHRGNLERETTEEILLQRLEHFLSSHFPQLKCNLHTDSSSGVTASILEITHGQMHSYPPAGYVYRVRLIVTCKAEEYHYEKQVLFNTIEEGDFTTEEDFATLCSTMLKSNGYAFCPRINYSEYMQRYYAVIWFHPKKVRIMETPFTQVYAKGCVKWFKLPKNATIEENTADEACCSFCKHLRRDLEHQRRKSLLVSPGKRANRQAASSNYPIKFLSPNSAEKRKTNVYK